jgi:hypothetical protein
VQRSRLALTAIGVAGLATAMLMVLWAAGSGPGQVASGGPRAQTAVPTVTASVSADVRGRSAARHQQPPARPSRPLDLSWLGELLETGLLVGGGWLLWLGARAVRDRMLEREHPTRLATPFDVVPDPADVADRLTASRHEQLARLGEGVPRNGIVRCWLLLEEEADELNVGPDPAETPTEFVTRFLHRLDVDPRAAGRLARLYQEARFSSHELTEEHRDEARQALLTLHADLSVLAGRPEGAGR